MPSLPLPSFKHCLLASLAAASLLIPGLQAQVPSRIESAISNARRLTLAGSVRPRARAQFDAGAMPGATRLQGISMVFNLSAAQQADLDSLLAEQQDPASPLYHQWLTPAQFGVRFGMASADLARVEAWLEQEGFQVDGVAPSRNRIRFSGTAAQVEAAFGAPLHYYQINGERHFAPASALSVPAALEPTVLGITNLDDFRPRPRLRPGAGAGPHFTSSVTGSVFFTPGDIAAAYDVGPLYSAGDTGAGQTIAVVGQSAVVLGDIEAFQSAAGLSIKDPALVLVPGTGASTVFSSDEAESDLDLEWAGATAPGADIEFVYVGSGANSGEFDALTFVVDHDLAPIISTSYGLCEPAEGAQQISTFEIVLKQAAAQGQTVIASGGDVGSTDCSGITGLSTAQQQVLAVDYPASSAYATGVGGTEVPSADLVTGTGYWQASSGTDVITSALQYIPETAWNDDSTTSGLSAGGGGASTLFVKPTWQAGVAGIPADGQRDVPDVALYGSPNNPGYLYCTSDTTVWVSGQSSSCTSGFRDGAGASHNLTVAGGTSFGSPIFAGMVAILNQAAGYSSGQGLLNPTLYALAAQSSTYGVAFHDVTSGNNDCTAGATYCSSTAGFSAGTGYDQVSGLGSVDLHQLALAWPLSTGPALIATSTAVSASSATPALNANVTFTITVSPASGGSTPSGSVALLLDGAAIAPVTLTANGTVVYSTSFTSTGAHQLLATYSGDSTHAGSTGVASVNVALASSGTGSFTLAASGVAVTSGGSGTSTITVTPAGGYTGTVLLSVTTSNASALASLCYQFNSTDSNGNGEVAVGGTAAVSTQLTLDANAADCSGGALRAGSGKRASGTLRPVRGAGLGGGGGMGLMAALLALASLLLMCFGVGGFRRHRAGAGLMVLVAVGLMATACGGGNNSGGPANPAAGSYTITITGRDSAAAAITGSAQFTLVIQ